MWDRRPRPRRLRLILGLIDKCSDISSMDSKNIARAIYHSSGKEAEERVNNAVVYLLDNKIVEEPDGVLRRVQGSPRHLYAVS